jgi:MFS family permease
VIDTSLTGTSLSDAGTAAAPGTANAAAHPPLRRNMAFQTLWAGSAASTLGLSVADVAYPLAILGVTGSPADAGFFAAAQAAGMILAGLPAGNLADRGIPRRMLILAEAGRTLVTCVVVAALVLGWLSLPLLLFAAVLLGIGQPMANTARMLLIRTVVPKEQLTSALTQDEVRINGAELAGPPLAGALYGLRVLAHAVPFLFIAAAFVLSLVSGLLVKVGPDRAPARPDPAGAKAAENGQDQNADASDQRSGMLAGIKTILASPVLRTTSALLASVNSIGAGFGIIAVVILRDQSVPSALIGVSLASGAVGGLVGATLVRPLHRLRPGVLMIMVCGLLVPLLALLALPYGPWWMAGLLFIAMLGVPSLRVLVDVLILRQAPVAERGRVVGAVMTLVTIGMPVGIAVSGLLLQYLTAGAAVLILAGLLAIGVLLCAIKPELWRARWPE